MTMKHTIVSETEATRYAIEKRARAKAKRKSKPRNTPESQAKGKRTKAKNVRRVGMLVEHGHSVEEIAAQLNMKYSAVLWYKQISDEQHVPEEVTPYRCEVCGFWTKYKPCQKCRALGGRKTIQKSGFGIRGDEEK